MSDVVVSGPFAHRWCVAVLLAALAACSSSPGPQNEPGAETTQAVPDVLDGVTGELILTRQRDLLDRGLINVLVSNHSGASLLLDDIELDASSFDAESAVVRTISIRPDRQVAVQVPFGEVDDCATSARIEAALTFTYTTDGESTEPAGRVRLAGTDLLESIRDEQCALRLFEQRTIVRFEDSSIVAGNLATNLVIEPTGVDVTNELDIGTASGTILVGVRSGDAWTGTRLGADPAALPLVFVVNRCDPHALGEVTKRFGLDLQVSIDGADPVSVAVDIGPIEPNLEAIVQLCRERTSND